MTTEQSNRRARFTLTLTLTDRQAVGLPMSMAIDIPVDENLRISTRTVDELKAGLLGSMEAAVSVMQRREFRRDLFERSCAQLGQALAQRMEDAEGWHDVSRIDSAREQLGGKWE